MSEDNEKDLELEAAPGNSGAMAEAREASAVLKYNESQVLLPTQKMVGVESDEYIAVWKKHIEDEGVGAAFGTMLRGKREKIAPIHWVILIFAIAAIVAVAAFTIPYHRAERIETRMSIKGLSRQRDNHKLYSKAEELYNRDECAAVLGLLGSEVDKIVGSREKIMNNRPLLFFYFNAAGRSGAYGDDVRANIEKLCDLDPDTPQWALAYADIFSHGHGLDTDYHYYSRVKPDEVTREEDYGRAIEKLEAMRMRLDNGKQKEARKQVDLCLAKLLVIDWQLRAINKYGYGGKWAEDADSPGVRQREDAYKIASGEGYEHAPEFLNLRKFICEKIKEKESNYYYFNGAKYWWQSKLNEEIKEIEKELASLAPPAK